MGSCTSANRLARSIDHSMYHTTTRAQSSDIKEPEHYIKFRREEIEIIWKETMTEVKMEESKRSMLTYSQLTDKTDKSSSFSSARYGVFTDSGSCSKDFSKSTCSKSTTESSSEFSWKGYDGLNKRHTNRYEIGLQMLKAMIHDGADPKRLVTHGDRTCLMFTVLAQDFDFVKELVKLGVDVNKTNSRGETAYGLANELHNYDIASYLRKNGAFEE